MNRIWMALQEKIFLFIIIHANWVRIEKPFVRDLTALDIIWRITY